MHPDPAPSPAPPERLAVVDVLRGLALLGILLVNVRLYGHPDSGMLSLLPGAGAGSLERGVGFALALGVEGKLYALYSLLFGLGLALQLERAGARGERFALPFLRRLLVLLLLGAAHYALLWSGDILATYALVGLPLLLLHRVRARTALALGTALLLVPLALYLLVWPKLPVDPDPRSPAGIEARASRSAEESREASAQIRAYGYGHYSDTLAQRRRELPEHVASDLVLLPTLLGLFLLGLALGKARLFHDPAASRARWRALLVGGLALGVPLNLAFVLLGERYGAAGMTRGALGVSLLVLLGGPPLALAYAAALALLWTRPRWRARLAPLAAVGRLSLTNYLLQSLAFTTLFYGYGLGLYGALGLVPCVLLALGFWALQLRLSQLWLARFRLGPVEWLWRALASGRAPPLRRQPEVA